MFSNEPRSDGPSSISLMIERLKQQDPRAAEEIWQRFFQRLLPMARAKVKGMHDSSVDEEDVLLIVFDRFFRAAAENRFARLNDRDDLWQILLMLTEREVIKQQRRAATQKRGGGQVVILSDLGEGTVNLRELSDQDPDPEFVAAFNDHLSRALGRLIDDKTREVALWKLEGYENAEIANGLQLSLSSVERKLRLVREAWEGWFDR